MPAGSERLVRLSTSTRDDREVSVYVKGFLGRGERPDHFGPWLSAHQRLVERGNWGPRAYGYQWQSGRIGAIPVSVQPVLSALEVYKGARRARRLKAFGVFSVVAADEAMQVISHFLEQYALACYAAEVRAEALAERLRSLRERYERVRIVAHSLGCRHVIEAVTQLGPADRPDEIHLCAPACREADVGWKLACLARGTTYLYHSRSDAVLELGFRALARGRALGAVGPSCPYPGLVSRDVGQHFGFWVHREYKKRFPEFVIAA